MTLGSRTPTVTVGVVGPQGPRGETGPQGPQGLPGAGDTSQVGNLLTANVATGTEALVTTEGFRSAGGTLASSTDHADQGGRSLAFTWVSGSGAVWVQHTDGTDYIPVLADTTYTFRQMIRADNAIGNAMSVRFYDANKVTITTIYETLPDVPTTFAEQRVTFVTPANTAYVVIRLLSGASSTNTVHFDSLGLWRGAGGEWVPPAQPIPSLDRKFEGTTPYLWDGTDWVELAVPDGEPTRDYSGDVLLAPDEDRLYWPGGVYQSFYRAARGGQLDNALQRNMVVAPNGVVQSGSDDFAPIRIDNTEGWRGGNHGFAIWTQAGTTLTVGDIGAQWTQGSEYITLLRVADGSAVWSQRHNAAGDAAGSSSAPSGTWTSTSGKPSVTFDTAPTAGQGYWADTVTDSGYNWDDPGRRDRVARTIVQAIPSWKEIVAKTKALGREVTPADCDPLLTLTTTWSWYGDQPNVEFVDVAATFHETIKILQWSGLQAGKAPAPSQTAAVGVVPGHKLVTWTTDPGNTDVTLADCVDSVPVTMMMSRGDQGSIGMAVLGTSSDRTTLGPLARTNSSSKLYMMAHGEPQAATPAGATVWVHGVRSYTTDSSDRQLHIIRDPATGEGRWWLMAGSTGMATHPFMPYILGAKLTQTRGTATIVPAVTATGVHVTGAGWAEGTFETAHTQQPDPHPQYPLRTEVNTHPMEQVATWAALPPATTADVGRRIRVTGGLGWLVAQVVADPTPRWAVAPDSDTGWYNITLINGWAWSARPPRIKRRGDSVHLEVEYRMDGTNATNDVFASLPVGWRKRQGFMRYGVILDGATPVQVLGYNDATGNIGTTGRSVGIQGPLTWQTAEAWPTTPPA